MDLIEIYEPKKPGRSEKIEWDTFFIGRGPAEITIGLEPEDFEISGKHLRIRRQGRQYFVTDISKFGTYKAGRQLTKEVEAKWSDELLTIKGKHGEYTLRLKVVSRENSEVNAAPLVDSPIANEDKIILASLMGKALSVKPGEKATFQVKLQYMGEDLNADEFYLRIDDKELPLEYNKQVFGDNRCSLSKKLTEGMINLPIELANSPRNVAKTYHFRLWVISRNRNRPVAKEDASLTVLTSDGFKPLIKVNGRELSSYAKREEDQTEDKTVWVNDTMLVTGQNLANIKQAFKIGWKFISTVDDVEIKPQSPVDREYLVEREQELPRLYYRVEWKKRIWIDRTVRSDQARLSIVGQAMEPFELEFTVKRRGLFPKHIGWWLLLGLLLLALLILRVEKPSVAEGQLHLLCDPALGYNPGDRISLCTPELSNVTSIFVQKGDELTRLAQVDAPGAEDPSRLRYESSNVIIADAQRDSPDSAPTLGLLFYNWIADQGLRLPCPSTEEASWWAILVPCTVQMHTVELKYQPAITQFCVQFVQDANTKKCNGDTLEYIIGQTNKTVQFFVLDSQHVKTVRMTSPDHNPEEEYEVSNIPPLPEFDDAARQNMIPVDQERVRLKYTVSDVANNSVTQTISLDFILPICIVKDGVSDGLLWNGPFPTSLHESTLQAGQRWIAERQKITLAGMTRVRVRNRDSSQKDRWVDLDNVMCNETYLNRLPPDNDKEAGATVTSTPTPTPMPTETPVPTPAPVPAVAAGGSAVRIKQDETTTCFSINVTLAETSRNDLEIVTGCDERGCVDCKIQDSRMTYLPSPYVVTACVSEVTIYKFYLYQKKPDGSDEFKKESWLTLDPSRPSAQLVDRTKICAP